MRSCEPVTLTFCRLLRARGKSARRASSRACNSTCVNTHVRGKRDDFGRDVWVNISMKRKRGRVPLVEFLRVSHLSRVGKGGGNFFAIRFIKAAKNFSKAGEIVVLNSVCFVLIKNIYLGF